MPNKFLIETALDIGISNLEKQRRTDPKKLYEEVKSALPNESSPEIQELYKRYIELYEASLKNAATASGNLKEELKWKHIGDLREAVKNGGKGLTFADIEGLNQFALAEYSRQNPGNPNYDTSMIYTLTSWFRIYESLKGASLEAMKKSYKDALQEGFLSATKVPFTIRYTEGGAILEVGVNLSGNKLIIGKKEHTLMGEKIQIGNLGLDKDSLYIPYTIPGKSQSFSERLSKKEFLDKYLDDILAGKDIRIQDHLVRVTRTGELTPRTILSSGTGESGRTGVETPTEVLSLDTAVKKGFDALMTGRKLEPLTVEHEGKKYRFPLEVDEKGFTLGGMRYDLTFPPSIRRGSFVFEGDRIVFSGIPAGESRKQVLFDASKKETTDLLNGKTGEVVFKSYDGDIRVTGKGVEEYLPAKNLISPSANSASPNPALTPNEGGRLKPTIELRWDIKAYAGYADQELRKAGKTVKELQERLKTLGLYKGEVNGIYDILTLNAVVELQKEKKIKVDGLVGTETIGALFRVTPNPVPASPTPLPTPAAPEPTRPAERQGDAIAPGGAPGPRVSPPESVPESKKLKDLRGAMEEFQKTYKAVSEQTGTLYDTPAEIQQYQESINTALKPVMAALKVLEGGSLTKEGRELYDGAVLDIARYFSDGYSKVKNRHYRNYDLSVDLALSLIREDLEKQKITLPKKPGLNEVLSSLAKYNPKLGAKIQADLKAGFDVGQILSNPRVRGEMGEVYDKVYKDYELSLQTVITRLRDQKTTFTNASGYKALDMLIFVMGTTDTFALDSWKARNRDTLYQTLGIIGSTGAGIGAFLVTPFTGGASSILGGALFGGAVTTAGMIWTKGRGDFDRETAVELGINTVTFGAGGALAKGANMIMRSGTGIARMGGIALDATGGLALGMSADHVRAWEASTGITLWESFKNNWYWALLPIALGMKGSLREKAEHVQKEVNRAKAQALTGDKAGATATLQKLEPQVAQVADEAKKAAPRGTADTSQWSPINLNEQYRLHISPDKTSYKIEDISTGAFRSNGTAINRLEAELAELKINAPMIHNQILELPTKTPTSPPASPVQAKGVEGTPAARATSGETTGASKGKPDGGVVQARSVDQPTPGALAMDEKVFTNWFAALVPKLDKKNFPAGSSIKAEGVEITIKDGGKYTVTYGGKSYDFDTHTDMVNGIGKIITSPSDRLKILKSTESNRILTHMKGFDEVVVPGTNGNLRWKYDGEGKMSFQKKDTETGSWRKVDSESLTPDEQFQALGQWYGTSPARVKEAIKKVEGAKFDEGVTPGQKSSFISRHGLAAWHKVEAGFKKKQEELVGGSKNLGNALISAPGNLFRAITGYGKGTEGWGSALAIGAGTQVISAGFEYLNDTGAYRDRFFDKDGSFNYRNLGEALAQAVIAKNFAFSRGYALSVGLWTYYDSVWTRKNNPGAQVPPPAK